MHTGFQQGFVNLEAPVKAKVCSHDKVLEKLLQNTRSGYLSCSEMIDHVTCFTIRGK